MKKSLLILSLASLVACTSTYDLTADKNFKENFEQKILFLNKNDLVGKEFVIRDNDFKEKITLGFSEDRVFGFSGVNRYFAFYKLVDNRLIIDYIGSTMMAGSDSAMLEEVKFLDILKDNKKIQLNGNTLTLFSNEGVKLDFEEINKK